MGMIATPETMAATGATPDPANPIISDPTATFGVGTEGGTGGGILQGGGLDFSGFSDGGFSTMDMDQISNNLVANNAGITQQQLQMQRSDLQLNPLPSLPSISNVGAVPFTGTVSTIPGGFQPLPQVAGNRKKLYQLSKFHGGVNKKSSPRDISDIECQEAVNVTVSSVGRIRLLGDCLNENAIGADIAADSISANLPGYGLFQFVAPADHDGAVAGEHVFTCVSNGDEVDIYNTPNVDGIQAGWMNFAGDDNTANAHVFYASGNGLYVTDANFDNASNSRYAKVYVDRTDFNQTITTKGWSSAGGAPLITSPIFIDSGLDGDISAVANTKVTLEWDDGSAPDLASTVDGAACVHIGSTGAGNWGASGGVGYYFYISWIFDGGVETGLTPLILNGDTPPPFAGETLSFNFSIKNVDDTNVSGTNYMGGDIRIEGARIYFKEAGTSERYLLSEVSLISGVRGALDSTYTPWDHNSDVYNLTTNIIFDSPPEVYSYSSLNSYYANEVYGESADTIADDTAGPAALGVRYKTAVVGSGGVVFIGNVKFDERHMPDSMMYSMPNKPGVFPQYNRIDAASSDGSPIIVLAAYRDTILQFKENGLYVINVSNPGSEHVQASFRDCGVFNPCQVFTTSFGVIFANKNGCYIYDGQRVTSLTDGKFDWAIQSYIGGASPAINQASNESTANFPCVGYDPRSQNIIVLKDIGDDSDQTASLGSGAWVYNMTTQSWTEGYNMITNGDGTRHTNFIITNDGYLAIKRSNDGTLLNYNHNKAVDTGTQAITYHTKDLDFGLPSQTKKLFKVYITYKGTPPSTINYRKNGLSTVYGFTATNWAAAGVDDYEIATLVPDDADEAKDWYSMSLYIDGTAGGSGEAFEINDISILYRARPIK